MTRVVVTDYRELDRVPQLRGVQVTVASSGFTYRFQRGHWTFVRRGLRFW